MTADSDHLASQMEQALFERENAAGKFRGMNRFGIDLTPVKLVSVGAAALIFSSLGALHLLHQLGNGACVVESCKVGVAGQRVPLFAVDQNLYLENSRQVRS
jgi:hypothetical protein